VAHLALTAAVLARAATAGVPFEPLVPLARPGPWSAVSGLVGYGERLWLVNSVKFANHNSADVWSYDPARGEVRYERHLFSQDLGAPVVAGGRLHWPFEDPRFSTGRGEYAVTDGDAWRWRALADGTAFHVHAMAADGEALYLATSAWRAGLQRSDDGGATWRVIYDHDTPPGRVSRITSLALLGGTLYAGLTERARRGVKLLRLADGQVSPLPGWPPARQTYALEAHRGWLYAVVRDRSEVSVWRTDGAGVEAVASLAGHDVRAFASGPDALWAVSAGDGGGALWRAREEGRFEPVQRFAGAEPVDVASYAGRVYVGTIGAGERGTLWGPAAPAPVAPPVAPSMTPSVGAAAAPAGARAATDPAALAALDAALGDDAGAAHPRARLMAALRPLALAPPAGLGDALSARLQRRFPAPEVELIGGAVRVERGRMNRWYLLWAMGLAGDGRVPDPLLDAAWTAVLNPAGKYLEVAAAAAWTAGEIGQDDPRTLALLVSRMGREGQPRWLDGDLVGALTALTGARHGYDAAAWQRRLAGRIAGARERVRPPLVAIPGGTLAMGSEAGGPAERPVHAVHVPAFAIDRFEVSNRDFAAFVDERGHVTDPERAGWGWHWDGHWHRVPGADWRHPRGSVSDVDGFGDHPVVQVSWHDARAYCAWRGLRLPTEAEWERAARVDGDRVYAWGDAHPAGADGGPMRAAYGADTCCRADARDGYRYTAPVGSFPAGRSAHGVEDLTGNVWEWVADAFERDWYARSPSHAPRNDAPAARKVIRGGGWGNNPEGLRAALRHANRARHGLSMVGFRCAARGPRRAAPTAAPRPGSVVGWGDFG